MAWKSSFRQNYRTTFSPTVPTSAAGISHVMAVVEEPGGDKWEQLKSGGKQWQATPKNLPSMQRTRAIQVAWLSSGLCPNRPKGWIPIKEMLWNMPKFLFLYASFLRVAGVHYFLNVFCLNFLLLQDAINRHKRTCGCLSKMQQTPKFYSNISVTPSVVTNTINIPSPSYNKHTPLVQNYAAKHRPSTRQTSVNHNKFQSITVLYSLMMDRIRSETCWKWFLILWLLNFYTT